MTETVEAKIEKLLRMAAGNANENESAVALQLAQKLADAHNLGIGTIGQTGARSDKKISKGLYPYQRTLYASLADLNHCKCWLEKGLRRGQSYQIRLLGSKVNVVIVQNMADYLENAVNQMVRDRFGGGGAYFSKDAYAFRQGMVDTLVGRVRKKREAEEAERQREKREQEARNRHPGAATENAIVLISDVAREEQKANYDYLHGEGAWDRREARIAASIERSRKAAEEYDAWALANPEEVARKQEELAKSAARRQKEIERNERRKERARQERIDRFGYDPQDYKPRKATVYDNDAYWEGRDKGHNVGLDEQIDEQKRRRLA